MTQETQRTLWTAIFFAVFVALMIHWGWVK